MKFVTCGPLIVPRIFITSSMMPINWRISFLSIGMCSFMHSNFTIFSYPPVSSMKTVRRKVIRAQRRICFCWLLEKHELILNAIYQMNETSISTSKLPRLFAETSSRFPWFPPIEVRSFGFVLLPREYALLLLLKFSRYWRLQHSLDVRRLYNNRKSFVHTS